MSYNEPYFNSKARHMDGFIKIGNLTDEERTKLKAAWDGTFVGVKKMVLIDPIARKAYKSVYRYRLWRDIKRLLTGNIGIMKFVRLRFCITLRQLWVMTGKRVRPDWLSFIERKIL